MTNDVLDDAAVPSKYGSQEGSRHPLHSTAQSQVNNIIPGILDVQSRSQKSSTPTLLLLLLLLNFPVHYPPPHSDDVLFFPGYQLG